MKKIIILFFFLAFISACEKNREDKNLEDFQYIPKIAGFDLNCSTCILDFSDDSIKAIKALGWSPDNRYIAINLNKGNYKTGQRLKAKIRKPNADELTPCITLYPSYNYVKVYITESEKFNYLILGDTVELPDRDCLFSSENQFYICLDSVLSDSRCPSDVYCIWAGNAQVRFRFEKLNEKPIFFNLITDSKSASEAIIDRYKISLIRLSPYPCIHCAPDPDGYKASIVVKEIIEN
jgi:hypothetical protein